MASTPPPVGIYVPVPTFFSSPNASSPSSSSPVQTLNLSLQARHTLFLAAAGVAGLVLAGSTGELPHLTGQERVELVRSTRKTLTDAKYPTSFPLIVGIACDNPDEVVKQLEEVAEAGAGWGMVLVPNYFASAGRGTNMQNGLTLWFQSVADKSPIPILIYHYPSVSNNVNVAMSTYHTLSSHPNIVGCKLSHGDVSIHTQLAAIPNFHVYSGLGQQLLPILAGGCHGAVDGLAGLFPRTIVSLFDRAWEWVNGNKGSGKDRKKELDEVRALQLLVSRAEDFVEEEGTLGIKYGVAKELFDGEGGEGRVPLQGGMSDSEWSKWDKGVFEEMRELERRLQDQ